MSDADAQSRKVAAEAEQYLNSTEAKQGHAKGDSADVKFVAKDSGIDDANISKFENATASVDESTGNKSEIPEPENDETRLANQSDESSHHGTQTGSVQAVPHGKPNGPQALRNAYNKYHIPLPDGLKKHDEEVKKD